MFCGQCYKYGPTARSEANGRTRRDFNTRLQHKKRRSIYYNIYIKQYRNQFRKADGDYYNGVQTSRSNVDGQWMGPFEAKYESMKKSLLVFTEMGSINAGLAEFINYIAEHVSPRIAGQWDVQGAWCNRFRVESQVKHMILRRAAGVSTRAFANHFFTRLKFVGIRSPNRNNPNKYHSMPEDTEEYSRANYFNDSYNSRDLNPTEPMDHGCGSRRE